MANSWQTSTIFGPVILFFEVDHVVNFQMPMGGGSIGASEHDDYGNSMENMWF